MVSYYGVLEYSEKEEIPLESLVHSQLFKKFLVFYAGGHFVIICDWYSRLCLTYRNMQFTNRY
jgi:hypothetical protein